MKNSGTNFSSTKSRNGTITSISASRKRTESAAEQLAAAGVDLSQLMGELDNLSQVNASRVVKLHDRIMAGEYHVDAERVAQKMLDFETALDQ